MKINTMTN